MENLCADAYFCIIFLIVGISSHSWIVSLIFLALLFLDYYGYFLASKETLILSENLLQHTSYNLLNKQQITAIPINEILNVELNKMVGPFTYCYRLDILRGLDIDEPLLYRKRTEHIDLTYWDNALALQIENKLISLLPRTLSTTTKT